MDPLYATSVALVGALAAIPTLYLRIWQLRRRVEAVEQDHDRVTQRCIELGALARQQGSRARGVRQRYDALKAAVTAEGVVETCRQPVLLVGPRGVGKSSLLAQWRAPWAVAEPSPTFRHAQADVPVCDLRDVATRAHPADPELVTPVHAHLVLRVHDVAGEVQAQRLVEKLVTDETQRLRESARRELGVVVVCMFDAAEAARGLTMETRAYYNGELFARLRNLVFVSKARIERLILVFNKVDRMREACGPAYSDAQLLDHCLRFFLASFPELGAICNRERIRGALAMLDSTRGPDAVRGASAVLGEAARALVDAFDAGEAARHLRAEAAREVTDLHFAPPPEAESTLMSVEGT